MVRHLKDYGSRSTVTICDNKLDITAADLASLAVSFGLSAHVSQPFPSGAEIVRELERGERDAKHRVSR